MKSFLVIICSLIALNCESARSELLGPPQGQTDGQLFKRSLHDFPPNFVSIFKRSAEDDEHVRNIMNLIKRGGAPPGQPGPQPRPQGPGGLQPRRQGPNGPQPRPQGPGGLQPRRQGPNGPQPRPQGPGGPQPGGQPGTPGEPQSSQQGPPNGQKGGAKPRSLPK
jgi:hypothetical protein